MSLTTTSPTSLRFSISLVGLAGALLSLSGCQQDIHVDASASATDDDNWFGTSSSVPTTGGVDPTDGGVDPTDGGLYPPDFCKLHPTDDYPGYVYVCSGVVHGVSPWQTPS